ncbi:putative TIGR00156 family protein [Edwardsiella tarda ATCC 23685]|uniref:Uncharacterized protein n=4 Tax=Hafniaceae TaxID=1903412 RepID=A0A2A7TXX8_EDWTA|nr:putative TIGR00156 family protein [Edwardsiella tarda ATCC 23685]PEH70965.1 hypothetical protein CRM76_02820 [Edwardsiella tarda]STD49714.1 Uncharacterized conserved protein [Edwardsiella tarda]
MIAMYRFSLCAFVLLVSMNASAAFTNNMTQNYSLGGFSGPVMGAVSSAEINGYSWMQDDKPVVLEGHIVSRLGGQHYLLQDAKGDVMVEIDQEVWWGVNATPQTRLRLYGSVDKDIAERVSIDVDRVEVLR